MDWTLEVVVLPVTDIDRAIAFYRDQVGFHLDHDTRNEHMHVAQLTPPGSGCSTVIGDLPAQKQMEPGSMKALQLVVSDAAAARQELLDRGVEVSELTVITEADGGTFFGFGDPDGNSWAVQEIKARERTPLIPEDHSGLGAGLADEPGSVTDPAATGLRLHDHPCRRQPCRQAPPPRRSLRNPPHGERPGPLDRVLARCGGPSPGI